MSENDHDDRLDRRIRAALHARVGERPPVDAAWRRFVARARRSRARRRAGGLGLVAALAAGAVAFALVQGSGPSTIKIVTSPAPSTSTSRPTPSSGSGPPPPVSTTTVPVASTATGPATATTAGPATTATTTTALGASATTVPATATTTQGAPVPPCPVSQLQISAGSGQGATGNWVLPILFRNTGPAACSLYGYPGVSWVAASGAQIGAPAQQVQTSQLATVLLSPGQKADSVVFWPTEANQQLAGCHSVQAAAIRVYAPGSTSPVLLTPASQGSSIPPMLYCNIAAGAGGVTPVAKD